MLKFVWISRAKNLVQCACLPPNGELLGEQDSHTVVFAVVRPQCWTAETPDLYRLEILCGDEIIYEQVGIRRVEVKSGALWLNGKPDQAKGCQPS